LSCSPSADGRVQSLGQPITANCAHLRELTAGGTFNYFGHELRVDTDGAVSFANACVAGMEEMHRHIRRAMATPLPSIAAISTIASWTMPAATYGDPANVSCFLRTAKSRLNMSDPTRQGRSRMLSVRDKRVLKRLIKSGMYDTASEIARNTESLGLRTVSADTIRRALRRQGLVARVKARAPALTKLQSDDGWCEPASIVTGLSVTGRWSFSQTKRSCYA